MTRAFDERAAERASANGALCTPQTPRPGANAPVGGGSVRRRIDDDSDLDLPHDGSDGTTDDTPRSTDREGDDAWDPGDDSDLGLATDEDNEDVGLDTATGLDEGLDPDGELDDTGEGTRWTTDSEADDDLADTDADLLPDTEDALIGDDDPPDDSESDDFDPGIEDDAPSGTDDGGIEGVDDDTELDDVDLSALPDIDADTEEDADSAGQDALDDLSDVALVDELAIEITPGVSWKELPARSVRCAELATFTAPLRGLCALGPWLVMAGGDQLQQLDDHGMRTLGEQLRGTPIPGALCAAELDGRVRVAVATDAGIQLAWSNAPAQPQFVAQRALQLGFTRNTHGLRLWARSEGGALTYSDDDGATSANAKLPGRVLSFSADGDRRVAALCELGAGNAVIASSSDGGRRFSRQALAAPWLQQVVADGASPTVELRMCRGVLVLILPERIAQLTSQGSLETCIPKATGPAVLVDEEDEVILYACVAHEGRMLLVRRPVREGASAPTVITALDPTQTGAPRLLAASCSEGQVALHLASELRLYRIDASLDGDVPL